jgi:hypothetical protein
LASLDFYLALFYVFYNANISKSDNSELFSKPYIV